MKKKILIVCIGIICLFTILFLSSNTFKVKTIEKIQELTQNTKVENIINENLPKIQYTNKKTINEITYQIIPQPSEKRLALALGKENITNDDIKEANKLICYEIRITDLKKDIFKNLNSAENDYAIKYFSNDMKNDIKLIISNDTIPCNLFHFERTFGIAPYLSFQVGFPYTKAWKNKPHHLIFNDNYFENGEIHLVNTYK